jgi:hypothetical protein
MGNRTFAFLAVLTILFAGLVGVVLITLFKGPSPDESRTPVPVREIALPRSALEV